MSKASLLIPLGVFALVVVIFISGFGLEDRHVLPSPLVGQPFPEFTGTDLLNPEQQLQRQDVVGEPTLVNVWATWCPTCYAEHEVLMQIAATGKVRIVGVNYKDQRVKAQAWLADYGNPYAWVVEDADGALGIELGVYGAPETFLLDASGRVLYKRVGNVDQRIWQQEILPRLSALGSS